MPYQQLLDRHSMMVFCRHIIEIDQGYPREQHKARMLPLLEEFKRRFNASIGTENNEFALLMQLSEQYFSKLKEAQTKCSTCEGFVKLIEKRRGDSRYAQIVSGWENDLAAAKEELIESLNELNELHHNIYAYSIAFSKKATSGIIY